MRSKLRLLALGAATLLSLGSVSSADTVLDLTGSGSSGSVTANDFFQQTAPQPTGSGVIQSFVRISTNETLVQGYNTDARPLDFDENSSPTFTRSLLLSDVPVVNLGGTNYRQFLLDINQTKESPLITLHELQIFVGNTGSPIGASVDGNGTLDFGSQASLIYDLDAGLGGNGQIELNYALNHGSGSGDMFAYIKDSLFSGTYVTLYSSFGPVHPNNDGYEEWAVVEGGGTPVVPLPMAAWGGMALCGFIGASKLRRRQQVD